MKKFIMFTFVVIGFVFSLFAEVKMLKWQNKGVDEKLFYSDSNEEYWTMDEIIDNNKPHIYWEEFDYTLGQTWEYDITKWPEREIEIVVPILKKYKYVLLIGDYFDVEYFLIAKNKVYGRIWFSKIKD